MTVTGLTSIILHDSYFRRIRTRIACAGHTNNTGDNGAGKTSALNLIPIFYGQEPNKLITRAGNKSSFVEYYLPSNQSLIVYEYTRSVRGVSEPYCVCLYRKRNENNYAYRFIKGSADDTIFHPSYADMFDNGMSSHDILRELFINSQIEVSSQIDNIIDYRDIIQGDYQKLRKRNRKSTFISYPRLYGLAHERVQHLGMLTSVVLRHDKLLAQFKTMLVDCFLRDQISLQQAPINNKNNELIEDLRSLETFSQHLGLIDIANQKAVSLLETWQDLNTQRQYSQQYADSIVTHQAQLTSLQSSLEQQYQQIKSSFDRQIDALKEQRSDSSIELKSQSKQWEALQKEHQKYQDDNIEQKRQALSNLDEYEQQVERQANLLADLQQSFESQKRDYDSKLLRLNTTLSSTTERINSQIEQVRQDAETAISQVEQERDKQQEVNQERLQRLDDTHRTQLETLQEQVRPIELAIEMIKHKVLSEQEQTLKAQLEDELIYANQQSQQWHQDIKQLQQQQQHWHQKRQHIEQQADYQQRLIQQIKEKVATLEAQLNPDNASLLSFLKSSQISQWQQTIAKVINPELVHRTDLQPQWSALVDKLEGLDEDESEGLNNTDYQHDSVEKDDSNLVQQLGLYGLDLALEAIETPQFAEDDLALRALIAEQVNELTELEQQRAEQGAALNTVRRELEAIDSQIRTLETKIDNNHQKIESIKSRQQEFEQLCDANRQHRLDEQRAQLQQHQQQRQQLKQKQASEKQQLIAQNKARLQGLKQQIATLKDSRDNEVDQKQQLISQAQRSKAEQEALLEQAYQQALREEGVDTQTLNTVKQEMTRLQSRYQATKALTGVVERYERWLKTEWVTVAERQATMDVLNDKIAQLDHDIDAKQHELTQALADKTSELNQVATRLQNLSTQAASIEGWQNQARPYVRYLKELEQLYYQARLGEQLPTLAQLQQVQTAEMPTPSVNLDSAEVPWLLGMHKLLSNCQRALDKVEQTAKSLHSEMAQYVGSQVYQAWQNRQDQYRKIQYVGSDAFFDASSETESDSLAEVRPDITHESNSVAMLSPEVMALLDVMSLQMVVNEEFMQLRQSIHNSFVTIGLDICNYYGSLNALKNKISDIGSSLAQDINTQHKFAALSDIRIELSSKIHEYAIWKDLALFNRHYQQWQSSQNELPDEIFINSFERVVTAFAQSQIDLTIDSLVEMTIQITENGRQVPIKTDNDLQHASSTGLSMLAVIVVFCGMTRYLCPDPSVTIHWPLDEIGKLSGKNTVLLFDLMRQYNVTLFCAQPDASPALNRFFINKNLLDLKKGVRQFEVKRSNKGNPLLTASKQQRGEASESDV